MCAIWLPGVEFCISLLSGAWGSQSKEPLVFSFAAKAMVPHDGWRPGGQWEISSSRNSPMGEDRFCVNWQDGVTIPA